MRLTIDTDKRTLATDTAEYPLYSADAFREISRHWLAMGWNLGHWTTVSWMGRQFLQLPDDALRLAEAVWRLAPDVVLETGVYEGGGTLLFATMCRMRGRGRVIAVEKDWRPGVRESLAATELVTPVEGDSAAPETAALVRRLVRPGESVFVFLDSDHSRAHVAAELEVYAPLVTPGSYIVVADTNLADLAGTPEGDPAWAADNPLAAADAFLSAHPEFTRQPTLPPFGALSYFARSWLQRAY